MSRLTVEQIETLNAMDRALADSLNPTTEDMLRYIEQRKAILEMSQPASLPPSEEYEEAIRRINATKKARLANSEQNQPMTHPAGQMTQEERSTMLGGILPDAIQSTLAERGKRYGAFASHAAISQELKGVMLRHGLHGLASDQTEALEMIAHKIARILNGDPNWADSWHDIAGYAQLVADRLNGNSH